MSRIAVSSITVTRATGRIEFCGKSETHDGWEAADAHVARLCGTVDRGMVDKCDFEITFEDGFNYRGTLELRDFMDRTGPISLSGHVATHLGSLVSDDPRLVEFRKWSDPRGENSALAAHLLEDYDLGGETAPSPRP